MGRLLPLLLTLAAAGAFVGGATASAPGTEHYLVSDNWQNITFVGGLDTCPLFGATSYQSYVLRDVDLTDHINSTWTPDVEPVYQIDSVGTLQGVINAPDGAYTVAGAFKEDRLGTFPWYFSGTGNATISGPGGTVVGQALFQDLTSYPPPEFDLVFTSITACHMK
jgi:hypothetical protein